MQPSVSRLDAWTSLIHFDMTFFCAVSGALRSSAALMSLWRQSISDCRCTTTSFAILTAFRLSRSCAFAALHLVPRAHTRNIEALEEGNNARLERILSAFSPGDTEQLADAIETIKGRKPTDEEAFKLTRGACAARRARELTGSIK